MAKLQTILARKNITVYRLCKLLDLGQGSHTRISRIMRGEVAISIEMYDRIKNAVKHFSDEKVDCRVVRVKL